MEVCEIQKEQVDARGCEMTRSPEAFKKVPLHQALELHTQETGKVTLAGRLEKK